MKRAKRRTSAEWSRLVSEQRSSGETREIWCNERGISMRTFRDWVYKLKREEIGGAVEWVELEEQEALIEKSLSSSGFIEVFIGSCAVRVKPDFDRALFSDICKLLSGLC